MKYKQTEFTGELRDKIKNTELILKDYIESLLDEYKSVFAMKNLEFDAGFDIEGNDPFMPGYSSTISLGIADENEELIDIHIIRIWECERYLLGMATSKKVPGSKVIGELIDETFEDIKEELKEYIDEFLAD
ncbi:hypothetical protein [Niallia sp. Man26]|uniref:hypothetical protein n=1 Tax=Niallia sp. Man26 TaxID=2912824 RepID=UPI001EDB8BD7|nr:hypothetical protein [Niallia sp. Man26]UPO90150.1 hypothetical protein L8T27_025670 [Niallia sp. Man26]